MLMTQLILLAFFSLLVLQLDAVKGQHVPLQKQLHRSDSRHGAVRKDTLDFFKEAVGRPGNLVVEEIKERTGFTNVKTFPHGSPGKLFSLQ